MRSDLLGNPVTCEPAMLPFVDDFTDGFLRYLPKAVSILKVADDSGEALPHILAGFLWMFWERPEAPAKARPHLARAEAALGAANDRERALAGVLSAWVAGDVPAAAARAEAVATAFPRDLAAMKIAQYHYLNMGDSPGILRVALRSAAAMPGNPQVAAMAAFGWEQCHRMAEARGAAEAALAVEPHEPWAHHALAHVNLTEGRIAEGLRVMEAASPSWAGLNSFMHTHNWWHTALFLLSEGRGAEALALYDTHVWGIEPDYSQDQIGAVSLLARLGFAGVDTGGRWQALRPWLETRAEDTASAFLTLQYLYGLARAGSPVADRLMAAVRERTAAAAPWEREMWETTGLPAAEGVLAAARGNFPLAVRRLSAVLPTLWQVGGSHAQRDLFDQILLDALLQDGRWVAAQQMLERRRATDPHGVPLHAMLGTVYHWLGLTAAAPRVRS